MPKVRQRQTDALDAFMTSQQVLSFLRTSHVISKDVKEAIKQPNS